ncbi:MAG: hypothetical protein CMK74_20390 [Pseudomonadales bacterium]|nr:hypothetical protein [Pseudomonadales bacterium]
MSIKIKTGLILRNADLNTAFKALSSIRQECIKHAQHEIALRLNAARLLHDDVAANMSDLESQGPPTLLKLMGRLYDAREQVLGRGVRSPEWDFTLAVALVPSGPDVLAIYYLENDPGFSKALASVGFEDYHYQNSSDRPQHIDEHEWREREAVWRAALQGEPACEVGLVAQVVPWEHLELAHFDAELMASSEPSESQRRTNVAQLLCELELDHLLYYTDKCNFRPYPNTKAAILERAKTVLLANVNRSKVIECGPI